jgi:AraC family transcriptional regulator, regulatory protein of adaptative response / methylated-DNA-[protein]-cysteine methyltransferase
MTALVREQASVDDATAWAAVVARDAAWDGRFVTAVATTRIYCRPSCGARRPRRENVTFYGSPEAAEAAGYRACRRCRPKSDEASATAAHVARARAFLDTQLGVAPDDRVTLERLAAEVGISPYHLQRTFKRLTGVTPAEYVRARRSDRLKRELRRGETVSRATYGAGYGSSSRVYERDGARLGMTPASYREGGRGARIRYTVVETALGRLLVAATERGVCAVQLGEDDAALAAGLALEYPNAVLERANDPDIDGTDSNGAESDGYFAAWVRAILRHLEGTEPALGVPVDVRGTAFQWRVWRALREIPYGVTRTYREVAATIGAPTATRAVAGACARNHVALVIPCHRVVREDGGLGGYRWGIERKRRLIGQERAHAVDGEGDTAGRRQP